MPTYFILLRDKRARITPSRGGSVSYIPVVKGTLWRCDQEVITSPTELKLHSMDRDGLVLEDVSQQRGEIAAVREEHFELLYAIERFVNRISVYNNTSWLDKGCHLKCGSVVCVKMVDKSGDRNIPAIVRFRGRLPSKKGIWFGLEMSEGFSGLGTCDGSYKGVRYFRTEKQSAVFETLDHLTAPDTDVFAEGPPHDVRPDEPSEPVGVTARLNAFRPARPQEQGVGKGT